MATFNFNTGTATSASSLTAGQNLTFDQTVGAQTVKFTWTVNDPGPVSHFIGFFPTGAGAFSITEGDHGDIYTLKAADTASAVNTFFQNTTGGKIFVTAQAAGLGGTWNVIFEGTKGTFTDTIKSGNLVASANTSVTTGVGALGRVTAIKFTTSSGSANDNISIDVIKADISCFMPGTKIATLDGEAPVETLRAGDMLRTADGGQTRVKWLGTQEIDPRLVHPAKINPICIRVGALGEGVPQRDLFVSGDHAVELDGVLYTAGALVNGRSIYQVARIPLTPFIYYHVETEAHELLLAEGCAAESYIDYALRNEFDNADDAPDAVTIAEMDLIRVSAARLVPDHIKAFLAERAEKIEVRAA